MFNLNCIVLEPRYRDESNRAHPPNRWTWNTFCVLQCKLSQIHFACLLGKTRLIQCLYFILFIVCNLHGLKMLGYNRDFFSQINNRSFVIKWVFCFKIVGVCHAICTERPSLSVSAVLCSAWFPLLSHLLSLCFNTFTFVPYHFLSGCH